MIRVVLLYGGLHLFDALEQSMERFLETTAFRANERNIVLDGNPPDKDFTQPSFAYIRAHSRIVDERDAQPLFDKRLNHVDARCLHNLGKRIDAVIALMKRVFKHSPRSGFALSHDERRREHLFHAARP